MTKEKPVNQEPPKPASPMDIFFKLGDKVTGGDPMRKASFDYYMMWIIFLAFLGVVIGNLRKFVFTYEIQYLGWMLFGLAIMWFQYFNLGNMRKMRAYQKNLSKTQTEMENKIENVDDMLKGFGK